MTELARTGAKRAGLIAALALSLAILPASGHEYPPIGTPAYDATCQIVNEWEDGGARAYCRADGETYVFDADGGFIYDHGIRFLYRAEGTWYVAGELLQIGPDAR